MEEEIPFGYLADDGTLYCSAACATRAGQALGRRVDQEEYEAHVEAGIAGGALCPACGEEFPVLWPERTPAEG